MQDAREIHIVVMGVAGCGKSQVGQRLAARLGLPLIEGDQFHSAESIAKMRDGVPLTDADRAGWLRTLGEQLASRRGAVLACSALRRAYRETLRDTLREASPSPSVSPLFFLFLDIDEPTSQSRVAARADHFYPASLVASQFAILEDPTGEPRVLSIDGTLPLDVVVARMMIWLAETDKQLGTTEHNATSGNFYAKQ
jgi:gluconokinase